MRLVMLFSLLLLPVLLLSGETFTDEAQLNPEVKRYLKALRSELKEQGYAPDFWVISTRRPVWLNNLLVKFGHARNGSQHLLGNAIDVVVEDVNRDGRSDTNDVNILYRVLDLQVVGNKGGVGTYKTSHNYFYRQMVHFDCRGHRVRWHF